MEGNLLYSKFTDLNVNSSPKTQKHPECLTKSGQHSSVKLTHKINHHKWVKRMKVLMHAINTTLMNLENFMLSERSQTQKVTYIPFI